MVRYLKRLKSSKFVRVKAFPMYGGIGVSAPSLHRESTDSLIGMRVDQHRPHTFGKFTFLWRCALNPESVFTGEYRRQDRDGWALTAR